MFINSHGATSFSARASMVTSISGSSQIRPFTTTCGIRVRFTSRTLGKRYGGFSVVSRSMHAAPAAAAAASPRSWMYASSPADGFFCASAILSSSARRFREQRHVSIGRMRPEAAPVKHSWPDSSTDVKRDQIPAWPGSA